MKTIENKMIFQYGMNPNKVCVTEEALKDALENFVNVPVMPYKEDDKYNIENHPIGIISRVNNFDNPYVYGDITLYQDINLGEFKNYGVQVEEHHEENDIFIVDKFKLIDVSFELL